MEKLNHIFIKVAGLYQLDEYENSHGVLYNYLYDLFKDRIIEINYAFRKWRTETKNENNQQINVSIIINYLYIFYNRIIFGNIILRLTLLY